MAFETQVKDAGAWRTGLLVSAKDAGAWRDVQEIWARDAGAWRQVYVRSDPLLLTFTADWSQGYAEDSHKIDYTFASDDMIQGDWDSVGHTHGTERGVGVARFTITGFGSRTNCYSCSVRLTCKTAYTSNGVFATFGQHEVFLGGTIATDFGHDHGEFLDTGGVRQQEWPGGSWAQAWHGMNLAAGNYFLSGARNTVLTHDYSDRTDTAGKELYRGSFYGAFATTDVEIQLQVGADYV